MLLVRAAYCTVGAGVLYTVLQAVEYKGGTAGCADAGASNDVPAIVTKSRYNVYGYILYICAGPRVRACGATCCSVLHPDGGSRIQRSHLADEQRVVRHSGRAVVHNLPCGCPGQVRCDPVVLIVHGTVAVWHAPF